MLKIFLKLKNIYSDYTVYIYLYTQQINVSFLVKCRNFDPGQKCSDLFTCPSIHKVRRTEEEKC